MSATEPRDSEWGSPSASPWLVTSTARCGSSAPDPREAVSRSSAKGSVLIVEDDRAARRAIAVILASQGFAVSEAGTVAQALRALAEASAPPQWVLLDLMLPDGCGIEVIRALRQNGIGSKVCIVTGCSKEL